MHSLDKLLDKKKKEGKELSPMEAEAKSSVLEDMRSMAAEHMGKKLAGLKKVSVASDSAEGLQHGLEKAKELVGRHMPDESASGDEMRSEMDEAPGEEEHADSESQESPEEEAAEEAAPSEEEASDAVVGDDEYRHMSNEELDQKLEALMKHKAKRDGHKE